MTGGIFAIASFNPSIVNVIINYYISKLLRATVWAHNTQSFHQLSHFTSERGRPKTLTAIILRPRLRMKKQRSRPNLSVDAVLADLAF